MWTMPVDWIPNARRKGCADCIHMKAAVSWWCTNEEAKKAFRTAIPGRVGCPFWEPNRMTPASLGFRIKMFIGRIKVKRARRAMIQQAEREIGS